MVLQFVQGGTGWSHGLSPDKLSVLPIVSQSNRSGQEQQELRLADQDPESGSHQDVGTQKGKFSAPFQSSCHDLLPGILPSNLRRSIIPISQMRRLGPRKGPRDP